MSSTTHAKVTHPRTPPKANISPNEYRRKLAKRIEDSMKAKRAANKKKLAQKRVMTSFSDLTKTYIVTEHSCTCPHFKFRCKGKGVSCKHMKQLVADLEVPELTKEDKTGN